MSYDSSSDSYELSQTVTVIPLNSPRPNSNPHIKIVETGVSSTQTVKCQKGKKYTLPYVVYEKTFPCKDYPPDEIVSFTNITVECDGKDCTDEVKWASKVKDANCGMKANIVSSKEISITWSTTASSRFDNHTRGELHDLNYHGWATTLNLTRPEN